MHWRFGIKISVFLVTAFILGSALTFARVVTMPNQGQRETINFSVNAGDGVRAIAQKLEAATLLNNERAFYLYVLLHGKRNSFYPGVYQIVSSASIATIVGQLTSGKIDKLRVRIIEGWRISDIASAIAKQTQVTAAEFEAAAPVAENEGYLFPDTYTFTPETTAATMVKLMRANFDKRTSSLNLTPTDVSIASIVEREAKKDEDRPKIAAVYLNRLKIGMALEADPTVQYAKGSWAPIRLADYRNTISSYNTYLHTGLPPTPIANPGLKSLQAVKNPAISNNYYFFTAGDGTTIYSKSVAEHNANKQKYLR